MTCSSSMGCGISKFDLEKEDPDSIHVRRRDRHTRIHETKHNEDDVGDHEERVRVIKKRVVGADERRPGVGVAEESNDREELIIEPNKKVVVVVPPATVQVVYGGDPEETTRRERDDSISCNPGSPSFRDYCIASSDSGDDQDDEEFGAKEEKISTKQGLLKSGKGLGTPTTTMRRVRGLRNVLRQKF